MLDGKFIEGDVVVDKYHAPLVDYAMSERDYVMRPDASAGPVVVTLPPVSLARGRFYSIIGRGLTMTNTLTINNLTDSEQWEGAIVLYETGQGCLLYSDGLKWMLRQFADIEIGATTRGSYSTAAAEIHGMTARAGRFRAEARSQDVAILVNADGVHAQGIAYGSLFAQTVNALYAEAIIKSAATVTTIRGAMITCDSEGTPTAIGTMYGAHIRCKTNVQPTLYRGLVIEHEQFGGLHALMDEFIKIIDSTFHAVDTCASYGLRMLTTGIITTGISLESPMVTGVQVTGAARSFAGTVAAVTSGSYGLSNVATLTSGASEGIAAYFEGHTALAAGNCFAVGTWLNIDSAPASGEMRALDVGVYGVGLDMSGAAVTCMNIGFHFSAANPPSAIYPIRFNNTNPGAAATALFRATQAEAINFQAGATDTATKTGDIPIVIGGVTHYIKTWDGVS